MIYDQIIESADDIAVKTYYKNPMNCGNIKIYNIEVVDISDLLTTGDVVFKSNGQNNEQTAHKDAVLALINFMKYSN